MREVDLQAMLDARLLEVSRPRQVERSDRLCAWGMRIGLRARDALHVAQLLREFASSPLTRSIAVIRWFGAEHPGHSFNVEPFRWLRLTELQVTQAIAGFLNDDPLCRIPAFMRALAPTGAWPTSFDRAGAKAEVRTRRGRIDLLLQGFVGNTAWVVVVEAKLDHHTRDNPLADYRAAALSRGLRPMRPGVDGGVMLFILGRSISAAVNKRLIRNRDWVFVEWRPVLRRFERLLLGLPDDEDFRRFRRTLWDRTR